MTANKPIVENFRRNRQMHEPYNGPFIGSMHPVFIMADKVANEMRMKEREKIITRKPRIVPMPTIEGCHGCEGPLYVTKEYKRQWDAEKAKKKAEEEKRRKRTFELDLLDCLGKRERKQHKLDKLKSKRSRDKYEQKKMILLKFQIQDLDERIEAIQKESGIDLNKEDEQSMLGRIWSRVKSTVSKVCHKVKKFFKRNKDDIFGICGILLTIATAAFFKCPVPL